MKLARTLTVAALIAGMITGEAAVASAAPAEDSPRWACTRNGNHICGPGNPQHAPAGFYVHGKMAVAWTDYERPWRDPLSALGADHPGSGHTDVPTRDAYGRPLSITPLPADRVPAWRPARKMTDSDVTDARAVAAAQFTPDGHRREHPLPLPPVRPH